MLPYFILTIPFIFYLLPALVPIWRDFFLTWGLVGLGILVFWLEPSFLPKAQDPLAAAIDEALRTSLTGIWLAAGCVQVLRGIVYAMGYKDRYLHWVTVLIVGLIILVVLITVW